MQLSNKAAAAINLSSYTNELSPANDKNPDLN